MEHSTTKSYLLFDDKLDLHLVIEYHRQIIEEVLRYETTMSILEFLMVVLKKLKA